MNVEPLTWFGIVLCISQSAMFSGLNLAVFSLGRLQLEVEAASGSQAARRVLRLREDPNFVLTTILWGNVGINVLLTLLSDSVLTGISAFAFSTVVITLLGEIAPQAYFSRHALQMASRLAPVLHFYQVLLYPVAKPSALILDAWLGKETIQYFREEHLKDVIRRHMLAEGTDLSRIESIGALNFLTIDDLLVVSEGVAVDPSSVIPLPTRHGKPQFPSFTESPDDPFLRRVEASGKTWVVITDEQEQPVWVLDADGFLRHALFHTDRTDPMRFCHQPVVITNRHQPLGEAIVELRFESYDDYVIKADIILVWGEDRRIITGADILGRLLRGVVQRRRRGKGAG